MRKDCVLSKLTEKQLADLFDSLSTQSYETVQKDLAQPPPDGIGERVHITTLFRFFQERQAQIRARDLASVLAASQDASSKSQGSKPAAHDSASVAQDHFISASQIAFSHSTYVLAHSPLNPANYRAVARALHQHADVSLKHEFLEIARQQLALARERLELDRIQFEYNAARAALALLAELNEIDRRTDIDDEAKVWRARDRLFGPASSAGAPASGGPFDVPPNGSNQSASSAFIPSHPNENDVS